MMYPYWKAIRILPESDDKGCLGIHNREKKGGD